MDELGRFTPRSDAFERYVFDEEERPGPNYPAKRSTVASMFSTT
jgi:hypothetical protein